MRKRIKLDIAELARLYFEEELTLKEVGARLGISKSPIRQRLLEAGYTLRSRKNTSMFSDEEVAEMVKLYVEEEESGEELAYQFDCSSTTIREYLKKKGVLRSREDAQRLRRKKVAIEKNRPPEPTVKPTEPTTPENIRRLRDEENLRIDEIAQRTGLSNLEVYEILNSS